MKKLLLSLFTLAAPVIAMATGWPSNYSGVMLQGFYWDSYSESRWTNLTSKADLYSQYFDLIWVPNSSNCQGQSMGYNPVYWFNHTSTFGNESTLRTMINTYKEKNVGIIEDVVINHKNGKSNWCDFPNESWNGNDITWSLADICKNDEAASHGYKPTGANDTGENFDGSRDLDHTSANVQKNVKIYLDFLLNDLGYAGFRYDMVKGYGAQYTKMYNQSAKPKFSVGEYYDGNHDLVGNWIKGTGYESAAFDFPLKFVMNRAFGGENWSELNYKGLAGDPNYNQFAVTFVDNHDTYRDDYNKLGKNVLAANAFILALPGTPCIFLPHFNQYQAEIGKMIKARKAAGINNNSSILQQGQQGGGYVMKVQGTKGSVLIIVGYVDGVDTKGYTLVSTGTNYAYFVSEGGGDDPTPDPEKKDINVYVKAAKAPYVYAWSGTGTLLSAAWPGDQVTKTTTTSDGTKWYTTTYNASTFNIVLNNGDGGQTADITGISKDIYLQYNGTTGYTDLTSQYSGDTTSVQLPECAKWLEGKLFCYFEGNETYTAPNIWAWNANGDFNGGTWPGTKLTAVGKTAKGNTVYLWDGGKLDENNIPDGLVFSTGTGSPQTSDFIFNNGGYYTTSGMVAVVPKPAKPDYPTGDVNGDKEVDITDVNTLINVIMGKEQASKYEGRADVNGDGLVDITDVNIIINLLLGK